MSALQRKNKLLGKDKVVIAFRFRMIYASCMERMSRKAAEKMIRREKQIVCLEPKSYVLFLSLALHLAMNGVEKLAKIEKGY